MAIDEFENLQECKDYVRKNLEILRPLFAKAAIGDFSEKVPEPSDDDEFAELYTGIQTIVEVINKKIGDLEAEIRERHSAEQRLIMKNKEMTESQKALLNVLEDLQRAKELLEEREKQREIVRTQ